MRSLSPTRVGWPGWAVAFSETSSASTCSVVTVEAAHAAGSPKAANARRVRYRPMLWIKALHIVFVVSWFAGLFYLPRLFVYHAQTQDSTSIERFKLMERKLYRGIMVAAMILT